MGRKMKWFDTVQRILSTSEPDRPVETEAKAAKSRDKSSFKELWQFTKSSNNASTSATPGARHQQRPPPPHVPLSPPRPEQQQSQEIVREAQSSPVTSCEQGDDRVCPTTEVTAQTAARGHAENTPARALPARSKEDMAAARIQAVCGGHQARRAHRERGMARLMTLVDGLSVKRQTEEALYCMQTMTRVQTQIYSRRLKTEEDKKALKSQIKIKQSFDKAKIGEGWDRGHQSKEQMESVLTMKQEAASRRERALAYAFSHQWSNRNRSSARAAPPPMFMDPGSPNWGWTWTERWMAAARPWENQTATATSTGRAPAKSSAGGPPRVAAITVQPSTTPGGRPFRPPNRPSSQLSPSTPPPRSPSISGRTATVPASPRCSSTLHAATGLQRTKSLQQPDRRPHQERAVAAMSSPRGGVTPASPSPCGGVVPASQRRSGSLQRAASMQPEHRPRSSQEHAASGPRLFAGPRTVALLRTTSLRSETPRRLGAGGAAPAAPAAAEQVSAPAATPSSMQPTTSVRAKARCASPSPSSSPNKPDAPAEKASAPPLRASSPSSAKKRMSLGVADKPRPSSPSRAKAERAQRRSQTPTRRTQLT